MYSKLSASDLFKIQHIKRWHMVEVSRQQTVAEHSFNVAVISGKLSSHLNIPDSTRAAILTAALLHDAHEIAFGDFPTPSKQAIEEFFGFPLFGIVEKKFWANHGGFTTPLWGPDQIVEYVVLLADAIDAFLFYSNYGPDPEVRKKLRSTVEARVVPLIADHELTRVVDEFMNLASGRRSDGL